MLTYEPGDSLAHRLDPRSKLAVQVGFAIAAFVHTTPRGLAVLSAVALGLLATARLRPLSAAWEFRFAYPVLLAAPVIEGLTWGSPWFSLAEATAPALAGYRVVLVFLVSAAYVRTTPARDSRAAVQRLVPGKPGALLGMGTGFVFRFLPLLQADLGRIREAMRARLGDQRPVRERIRIVTTGGLNRAFGRADTFALALRARCFSWNPTLPPLRFGPLDLPALLVAAALFGAAVVPVVPLA